MDTLRFFISCYISCMKATSSALFIVLHIYFGQNVEVSLHLVFTFVFLTPWKRTLCVCSCHSQPLYPRADGDMRVKWSISWRNDVKKRNKSVFVSGWMKLELQSRRSPPGGADPRSNSSYKQTHQKVFLLWNKTRSNINDPSTTWNQFRQNEGRCLRVKKLSWWVKRLSDNLVYLAETMVATVTTASAWPNTLGSLPPPKHGRVCLQRVRLRLWHVSQLRQRVLSPDDDDDDDDEEAGSSQWPIREQPQVTWWFTRLLIWSKSVTRNIQT